MNFTFPTTVLLMPPRIRDSKSGDVFIRFFSSLAKLGICEHAIFLNTSADYDSSYATSTITINDTSTYSAGTYTITAGSDLYLDPNLTSTTGGPLTITKVDDKDE